MIEKKWVQYTVAAIILAVGIAVSLLIWLHPWTVEHFSVRFYGYDGELLETQKVRAGDAARPPALQEDGHIFKRWNRDLYVIWEDMDVSPVYEPVGEEKNIVYADAVYAETGDVFVVTPKLSGAVNCSGFTIEIGYDHNLLSFEGAELSLQGLSVEQQDGILTLRWSSDHVLDQPTELAVLRFRSIMEGPYCTNFPFLTKEIVSLEQGDEVYTDSTAYEAKLYLYE